MVANRRNLIFRVSIVINICVLLYTAMHLSGTPTPSGEWVAVPLTGEGGAGEARYLPREDARNDSLDATARNYDESTSFKTPSTAATANNTAANTASSTAAVLDTDKNMILDGEPVVRQTRVVPYKDDNTFEIQDENFLTKGTLARLKVLLGCHDREFLPQFVQRGEFWVLRNYVRAQHGPVACHETITYTTHAGFEFLDNIKPLVERWMAPISVAVHAPGTSFEPTVDSIKYLRDCIGSDLVKQFVTFHLYFSYKHIPSKIPDSGNVLNSKFNCSATPPFANASNVYMKDHGLLYPVNVGRNIARDAAMTHYILPSDIELYPSPNLIPKFLNMIAKNNAPLNSTNPKVFPISLFEVAAKVRVPSTKTELRAMLSNKTAIPFHKYVCPNCHNIPRGAQWMGAKETNQMQVFHVAKRTGKHAHWEPIYIGSHRDPLYDERLSWEGKQDKMSQSYILCVKNYDFMILNNAFLIHKPGIKHIKKDPKRDVIAKRQSAFLKSQIMPELKKLFGTRTGCML